MQTGSFDKLSGEVEERTRAQNATPFSGTAGFEDRAGGDGG